MKRPFSNEKSIIELYGTVNRETKLAVYVDFGDKKVWLPKSQIEDWPDLNKSGEILMPEWLAAEKELI